MKKFWEKHTEMIVGIMGTVVALLMTAGGIWLMRLVMYPVFYP